MCHFKDSLEEKGSFDEKEEITLFLNNVLQTAEEVHLPQQKSSKY